MSKQDLIDAVAERCDMTKDKAKTVVDTVVERIAHQLKAGHDVRIPEFGTFKVTKRKARDGINPLTKAPLHIPASNAAKFTPAKKLKELLN